MGHEVLVELHAHGAGVADGVGQVDGEHGRARHRGGRHQAVEEDGAVRDVGEVGTQAGQGHPPEPADEPGAVEEGGAAEEEEARGHDGEGRHEAASVFPHEVEQGEDAHDAEHDEGFGAADDGLVAAVGVPEAVEELDLVVVAVVAVGGEEEVGEAHQAQAGPELAEERRALRTAHGLALDAFDAVGGRRRRELLEEPDGEGEHGQEMEPGDGGHPGLADLAQGVGDGRADGGEGGPEVGDGAGHEGAPEVLGDAAGDDEGEAEAREEDLGGATAFEIAHDEPPYHAEGEAVEEDGRGLPSAGKEGVQDEGGLGDAHEDEQGDAASGGGEFGAKLDAQILGRAVAEHLADHEGRLELELQGHGLAPQHPLHIDEHLAVKPGGRERLAEGVHGEVRRERRHHGHAHEDGGGGAREPLAHAAGRLLRGIA